MAYFFISFFIFLSSTGITPVYANEPLPDKMLGNWAIPDCRAPEELLIHSKFFSLSLKGTNAKLFPVSLLTEAKDYTMITSAAQKIPMRVFNDGILEIASLEPEMHVNVQQTWNELPIDQRHEYTRCLTINATIHEIGITALKYLDAMHVSCSADTIQKCYKNAFDLFDTNRNTTLSGSELIHATHMLLYITQLSPSSFKDMSGILSSSYQNSAEISDVLIDTYDTDKSGNLSFMEIQNFTVNLVDSRTSRILKNSTQQLRQFFPIIQP